MARPIPFDAPLRDARLELQHRLERAPAEHAAALLDAYELLQVLHDNKIIDTLRGLVGSGETVLDIAVDGAKSPESVRVMRNMILLFNVLGSIDPETLKKFVQPIPQALQVSAIQTKSPGLWSLTKSMLWDGNVRRGIAASVGLLRAVGMGLTGQTQTEGPHGEHAKK